MKCLNEGVKNEYAFAKILDHHKYSQLTEKYQELLTTLYGKIEANQSIECWVSQYNEKSDIKIRINGIIKGISVKMGHHNSVHFEHIDDFTTFMKRIGITERAVEKFAHFVNWSKKNKNIKSYYYKKDFTNNWKIINEAFSDYYIQMQLFSKLLFQGSTQFKYSAHALISGTPNQFIWATRNEIMKILLKTKNDSNATIKIGLLTLQVVERNSKTFVEIKWHTLEKILKSIEKSRNLTKM